MTLDDALDELYGVVPGDFVATRKALASQLRDGGDAGAAKELSAARRPTTAAWALNRLAREEPALVDDLIERSSALRAAQSRASASAADELRQASTDRRRALNAATDAAVALAAAVATNPEAHRDAIAATLESGSVDETVGTALQHGRLVREAAGPVGFPEFAPLKVVPGARKAKRTAPETAPAAAPAPEGPTAAEERAGLAQAALEAAEEKSRDARRRESELAVVAGEAEQRLEERQAELATAHDAVQAAKADVRAAHGQLQKARRAAAAADRSLEKARATAERR